MKKNMGTADQLIRILIAIGIGALYYFKVINGTMAIVLGALAVIFLLTSFVGVCPLYIPFKISTRKNKQ